MVITALPTKLLLLSASPQALRRALEANSGAYDVTVIGEAATAMEMLSDSDYDMIVLDDALFGAETLLAVREIRRRHPLTPLLVATTSEEASYHIDLLEAGAADVLNDGLYTGELHRRLRLVLQQRRQNLALARRSSNLQALVTLARRLHAAATDPRSLLVEAIDTACRAFGLYGMAVALREGDLLHIFAGREGAATSTLFESSLRPHTYDPFMRVIETGFVQTFQNIQQDAYYTNIPALPRAESAIVLPLAYPEYMLGALAVFGSPGAPVDHNDLIIYELFASQFTTAYQNALHYAEQEKRVKFSAHLLKAWQRFVSLNSPSDIAAVLREMVEDIPSVNQALVWLYEDEDADRLIVRASSPELADTFRDLHQRGHITSVIEQMDDRMQVTLQLGLGQKDPLGPLFRGLRGQQLMLLPISDAARIAGGVVASAAGSGQFALEDANLMKSLAHAAGQALMRTTLTNVMAEKGGRLEAILRSIYEGIVFVDNTNRVAFANTQFTELTAINPSDVLNREPEALLSSLAAQTSDPDKTLQQLRTAVASVLDDNGADENYSILELSLIGRDREISVEFARITSTVDNTYLGWIAIVRDSSRFKNLFSAQMSLLDIMSERIRVPYAELRGLITTLIENHNRLNNNERARFLRRVEKNLEVMSELWENFFDIYHLELTGLALEREEVDLYNILQRALESRIFSENRRQFQVDAPARLPSVRVDELRMERALSNMLQSALALNPPGAPVKVRLEGRAGELRISVHTQGAAVPSDDVERLFDPLLQFDDNSTASGLGLGLYLGRELIERHGGRIWAECVPGKGTLFTVSLPAADSTSAVAPATARAEAATDLTALAEMRAAGYSVQKRQPKTIMVIEGKSKLVNVLRAKLEAQGYEMLVYCSADEALRDVNAVRLDLIVLDVNLADANSLDVCDRLRKRTESPIVMLADEASEAEEVRALKQFGADAFIAGPISEERLLARVDVILKRIADLPTRTREPLDLGNLVIDFARREVYLNNKPVELTRIEYDLLTVLALNENQVLTHKQLLDKVWGPEYQAETQYLWVNVSRLRKKLEPTPDSPRYIHTQQGVGYVFRRP